MGTWKLTVFEYHSHDGHLDLFSHDDTEATETEEEKGSGGTRAIEAVIGLAFLVALGMAVRHFRNGQDTDDDDAHEVTVAEYEE